MSFGLLDIILKDKNRTEKEIKEFVKRLVEIEGDIIRLSESRNIPLSEAIAIIAHEKNIDIGPIEYDILKNAVVKGIEWLKSQQHPDKGWGWGVSRRYEDEIRKELKKSTLTNAWFTSVSLLSLNEWKKYSGDQTLNEFINKGIGCLKENCNQDGCWSPCPFDLPRYKEYTNVFDTSLSVLAILEVERDPEFVSKAINKLKELQEKNGGWKPSENDKKIDTGATSLAIQALIKYRTVPRFERPIMVKEEIKKGIEWLIKNQQEDGGWSHRRKGKSEGLLTRTYDALEALTYYDPQMVNGTVKIAVEQGINWLLDSIRFEDKDKVGLAWRSDKIQMSNIENTATSIIALLNCGIDPTSLEIDEGTKWLLEMQKEDGRWGSRGVDTPRGILCLIRYMEKMYGEKKILQKIHP